MNFVEDIDGVVVPDCLYFYLGLIGDMGCCNMEDIAKIDDDDDDAKAKKERYEKGLKYNVCSKTMRK